VKKLVNRAISNILSMKLLKILIVALLMFILLITACAAFWATSPSLPFVKLFDVSRKDSTVSQEIKIREYRSYIFALQFDYFDKDDGKRIKALVGDGSRIPDKRYPFDPFNWDYAHPGITIPIHIKIIRIETGKNPETVYDDIAETKSQYAGSYSASKKTGHVCREIVIIDLKPGIYRIETNTIKDSPEFMGTQSYLRIETHWDLNFLPGAVNKKERPIRK
jgi:hypothetical protein